LNNIDNPYTALLYGTSRHCRRSHSLTTSREETFFKSVTSGGVVKK
jgi:hypothetical protein